MFFVLSYIGCQTIVFIMLVEIKKKISRIVAICWLGVSFTCPRLSRCALLQRVIHDGVHCTCTFTVNIVVTGFALFFHISIVIFAPIIGAAMNATWGIWIENNFLALLSTLLFLVVHRWEHEILIPFWWLPRFFTFPLSNESQFTSNVVNV